MTPEEALDSLGVSSSFMTDEESKELDEKGFVRLENVLSKETVTAIRQRMDEIAKEEGADAGKELHQEDDTIRLANLVDKDPLFEILISTPRVLAFIQHVIGSNITLSSLSSRSALKDKNSQGFHTDTGDPAIGGKFTVCNSAWLITDFTEENGATRVVPGSHRFERQPDSEMKDTTADHPDQVQFIGNAGDVVIFNSNIWHAGAANHTANPRTVVLGFWTANFNDIQNNHEKLFSDQTKKRLSPELLALTKVKH